MSLVVTGIGRYIGDDSAGEQGMIIFNKGEVILLVDNKELQKIVPHFKPKGPVSRSTEKIEESEEDFYLDPSFLTDEQAQRMTGVVEDNEYSEDSVDEDGMEEI